MAYNYNMGANTMNQSANSQQQPMNSPQMFQQNIQPLFPQPQGNVYNINSTLEVANVPVGAGISVALCLPENVMYIKTMQNGNPLFYPYKIVPFNNNEGQKEENSNSESKMSNSINEQLQQFNLKINDMENQINKIKESLNKTTANNTAKKQNGGDWIL